MNLDSHAYRPGRKGTGCGIVLLVILLVVLLSGCANVAEGDTGTSDTRLSAGRHASLLQGEKALEAILCAQQFAENHWRSGTPAEIGDASLDACAAQLAAYAEAATGFNKIKAGLVSADGEAVDQGTTERWAGEDVERQRAAVRAAAIRRALELQRTP
jgi:ferric-dicitrate binding protein FerR (iron transport regulator)